MSVTVVASMPTAALAHGANNYFVHTWAGGETNVPYKFTAEVPTLSFRDRIRDARDEMLSWVFFFADGQVPNYSPTRPCDGHFNDNGIHYRDPGDPDFVAVTHLCYKGNGDLFNFNMVFDEDRSWYRGTGDTPNSQYDLQATATHEFGHAAGGWTTDSPFKHFDKGINPDLCGDNLQPADFHTMCKIILKGHKQQRTLNEHDIHVYLDAYP